MKHHLIITILVNILIQILNLFTYKVIVLNLGFHAFSEYALFRRILAFLQTIGLLGLGVGLTKYISLNKTNQSLTLNGFIIILVSSLLLNTILILFKDFFSILFFGAPDYRDFIYILALMLIGLLLHSFIYNYFRGHLKFSLANLLQLINLGLIPILSFLYVNNLKEGLFLIGVLWNVISINFIFFIFFNVVKKHSTKLAWNYIRILLTFSIQRIPADLGLSLLFITPILATSFFISSEESGIMAFSISLINLIAPLYGSLGIVFLPKISVLYKDGKIKKIKIIFLKAVIFAFLTSSILYLIFDFLGIDFLECILDPQIIQYWNLIQIVVAGIIPYSIYLVLRSIIDAIFEKSYNSINIMFANIILLIGILLLKIFSLLSLINIGILLIISLIALASLSFFRLYNQLFKIK